MSAPRIIPAGPMPADAILPLIREVFSMRERGHYAEAAELEERIRQPLTVAWRVLMPCLDGGFYWTDASESGRVSLMAYDDEWRATLMTDGPRTLHQVYGAGPTIAAALADARDRYQAALPDTLLRMSGLLREVTK